MKSEKVYIVISHYSMRDSNIGLAVLDTIEEAMKEATFELEREYTIDVEIYESPRAEYFFFGKQISKHTKK